MTLPLPPADPSAIGRVAFLGTPALAVPTLRALHDAGYEIPIVVTGEDKRRGRGKEKSPTPVKAAALELNIAVTNNVSDLLDLHVAKPIDLAVVVAFGQLIRLPLLEAIPMVNIHFSDLPRWRGAAPVERALLSGDSETAIAIMSVVEALDEGDVWAKSVVPITPEDTLVSLWESMSVDGANLLVDTMRAGFTDPQPQVGESVYARKLVTADGWLDWSRPAVDLLRVIRVGRAWTVLGSDRLKVHDANVTTVAPAVGQIEGLVVGTGEGGLELVTVQPAGKPRMDATSWANGAQPNGRTFERDQPDG